MNFPKLIRPKIDRVPYARLSRNNKLILGILYICIVVAVIGILYMVGSIIRTRFFPAGGIQLSVPYSKYLVGETVTFTIKNNFNSPIYITNNCPVEPLEVYRQEGGKWVRLHDTASSSDCPKQNRQIKIPGGSSINGTFGPWHHLFNKAGKYRIVAYVEYYNSLPYQDFEVINKPVVPKIPALLPSTTSTASNGSSGSTSTTTTKSNTSPKTSSSTSANSGSQATTPAPTYTIKTITLSQGTINIKYSTSSIYILSVTPATGWTYEGGGSGNSVQITFKRGEREVQVTLYLQNGQLHQQTETNND